MANKQPTIEYQPREQLDAELESAINEILDAENEARRIVEQASSSVKALQLDAATRERTMRDMAAKQDAAYAEAALSDAQKRADEHASKLIADARDQGEKLISSKAKDIEKTAAELFRALGSK